MTRDELVSLADRLAERAAAELVLAAGADTELLGEAWTSGLASDEGRALLRSALVRATTPGPKGRRGRPRAARAP